MAWPAVIVICLLVATSSSYAQLLPSECGSLVSNGRFGPFDYRPSHYVPEGTYKSHAALLNIVESAHFTPEIEANIRGKHSTTSGKDMSYTLHAFPNHHRALVSMVALGEKEGTDKPRDTPYVVECWFKRAIAFRPDDHIVRMIYASFLVKHKRDQEAEAQLREAAKDDDLNAFTYRNIGLIYFDMKRYDEALRFAHKSQALGLASGPLQERLVAAGLWTEPPDEKSPKQAKP
jgi:tetratricopeptide (TPR) repeat protein